MKRKHLPKLLGAFAAAALAVAVVAPVAQADTPNPGYEQFAGCPSLNENPAVEGCIRSVITGGHFQMGNKDVPISNPITLVGGTEHEGEIIFNSKGGLTPVKQQVPGGIIGLTGLDWLVNFLSLEGLKLYAVTELAGTPVFGLTALSLPIKVHLINPVLGSKCYVGSTSNPIELELITGTTSPPSPNEPITGKNPKISLDPSKGIFHAKEGIFVDNSFAAPGASGCVLTLFGFIPISINGLVNSTSGLPSAAGTNETVQNFESEVTQPEFVYP